MLAPMSIHRSSRLVLALVLVLAAFAAVAANPAPAAAVTLSNVRGVVNAPGGLNVRTKASTSGAIIRTLPNGTKLAIVGTSGDWFQVTVGTTTGYVNSWYVTLSGTPSSAIWRGATTRKMVALTFDAGSDLGNTERIITILEEYEVRASFGLTGDWIDAYSDYAAWIAADGHQLLNHTRDHPSYTGASTGSGALSPARRLSQLVANEAKLRNLAGAGSKPYWRPPYGDYDWSVLRDVGAAGYAKTIFWSIDTMGWDGATPDQIYRSVVDRVGNGSIILMHVGGASRDVEALERVIQTLRARGYAFGTVAQVIAPS